MYTMPGVQSLPHDVCANQGSSHAPGLWFAEIWCILFPVGGLFHNQTVISLRSIHGAGIEEYLWVLS